MILTPELFFNLKAFDHAGVFGTGVPVWAALKHLPFYLGSMLAQAGGGPYRTAASHPSLDPTVRIENPHKVLIAPTAIIKPYTVIEGQAIIDDGAVVGPHAYLRDSVIICRGARVGHGTEVKRSIMFPGAKASHGNRVLDSLIGWHVNLGAHLITANWRRDGRTVPIRMAHGKPIDTGLKKLGLIAGDGCFFSCGVKFNPGDYYLPNSRL